MLILPASSASARGSSISLRLVSDFKGHQLGLAQALDAQAVHIAVPDPGGTDSSRRSGVGRSTGRLLDFGGETGRRLGCNPASIKRVDDLQVPAIDRRHGLNTNGEQRSLPIVLPSTRDVEPWRAAE